MEAVKRLAHRSVQFVFSSALPLAPAIHATLQN